jgi:hypothetical protein
MAAAAVVVAMVEVDTVEAEEADVVSSIMSFNNTSPVPSADGTNKDVGRRFHLF